MPNSSVHEFGIITSEIYIAWIPDTKGTDHYRCSLQGGMVEKIKDKRNTEIETEKFRFIRKVIKTHGDKYDYSLVCDIRHRILQKEVMKQKPKKQKPIIRRFNDPIESIGGETIEGVFTSLQPEEQIEFLFSLLGDTNEQIFRLQQQVDYLSFETGLSVEEVEMLQRKELWTTEEVCGYFNIDARTLRRGAKSGEWTKPHKVGGRNYYKLQDLKEQFREKDGNLDTLNKVLGYT